MCNSALDMVTCLISRCAYATLCHCIHHRHVFTLLFFIPLWFDVFFFSQHSETTARVGRMDVADGERETEILQSLHLPAWAKN